MDKASPLDAITHLVKAMNAWDLESAAALFEPGAAFVIKPGIVVNEMSGAQIM